MPVTPDLPAPALGLDDPTAPRCHRCDLPESNATHRRGNELASAHPFEISHACPTCGAPCVCAEFSDGEPCHHHASHGCVAPALGELARLARVLIEARHEQCAALASADTTAADLDRAARCTVQATANFTEFVMSEWVLVALASGGAEGTAAFANGFIGWIGSGCNTRGQFPRTLSELSDDIHEFRALTPERPADAD